MCIIIISAVLSQKQNQILSVALDLMCCPAVTGVFISEDSAIEEKKFHMGLSALVI